MEDLSSQNESEHWQCHKLVEKWLLGTRRDSGCVSPAHQQLRGESLGTQRSGPHPSHPACFGARGFHCVCHRGQHPRHPLGGVQQAPADPDELLHHQPGHRRPAAGHHGAAGVGHPGNTRLLGVWSDLLWYLGRSRCAVLHRVHHEPVRNIHRPLHRSEPPAAVSKHRDREAGSAGHARGVGAVGRHLHWTSVRVEAAAVTGRHRVSHHRGAVLRALLLPRLLLHPSRCDIGYVLPGVHCRQTDHKELGGRCDARENELQWADPEDPQGMSGAGGDQLQYRQGPRAPSEKLPHGETSEILPREESSQNFGSRGRHVYALLAALLSRLTHR